MASQGKDGHMEQKGEESKKRWMVSLKLGLITDGKGIEKLLSPGGDLVKVGRGPNCSACRGELLAKKRRLSGVTRGDRRACRARRHSKWAHWG